MIWGLELGFNSRLFNILIILSRGAFEFKLNFGHLCLSDRLLLDDWKWNDTFFFLYLNFWWSFDRNLERSVFINIFILWSWIFIRLSWKLLWLFLLLDYWVWLLYLNWFLGWSSGFVVLVFRCLWLRHCFSWFLNRWSTCRSLSHWRNSSSSSSHWHWRTATSSSRGSSSSSTHGLCHSRRLCCFCALSSSLCIQEFTWANIWNFNCSVSDLFSCIRVPRTSQLKRDGLSHVSVFLWFAVVIWAREDLRFNLLCDLMVLKVTLVGLLHVENFVESLTNMISAGIACGFVRGGWSLLLRRCFILWSSSTSSKRILTGKWIGCHI